MLFSCVDRPWARLVLNLIAYAHLIPVVDGGISVERTPTGQLRSATWRAHVAAPGRRCLECLEQYDPGLVQAERDGLFENRGYIDSLPEDHVMRQNQNVFAFSMSCASFEVGQFLSMVVAPGGVADYGARTYRFVTASLDDDVRACEPTCPFSGYLRDLGDLAQAPVTGIHAAARAALAQRKREQREWGIRALRAVLGIADRLRSPVETWLGARERSA